MSSMRPRILPFSSAYFHGTQARELSKAIEWPINEDAHREMQKTIRRQLRVAGVTDWGTLNRATGELMQLARTRL